MSQRENTKTAAVIPSEVENGAAGEAATWTGRPEAERTGVSESNLLAEADQKEIEMSSTSLDMTKSEGCAALLDLVRRDLELVAVRIAEINRVRDFVILEFEFDSALL